jgi:hypothetical protein
VYLVKEAYSRPEFNQAGTRNKMMEEKVAGPYLITWVSDDGQAFDIERPEFMKRRASDHFNIKVVREFIQQHADPRHLVDAASDEELGEDEYQISSLTGRRWDNKSQVYQYRVRRLGHMDEPEAYGPEADISANRLISEYDAKWPRGCASKTDDSEDVAAYQTEVAKNAAGRGRDQSGSPPSASARPALVSSPTTTAPARRHTLVGKVASDAVLRYHPYNLRGSGHSSMLTAMEVEVMDSAEVFSFIVSAGLDRSIAVNDM